MVYGTKVYLDALFRGNFVYSKVSAKVMAGTMPQKNRIDRIKAS